MAESALFCLENVDSSSDRPSTKYHKAVDKTKAGCTTDSSVCHVPTSLRDSLDEHMSCNKHASKAHRFDHLSALTNGDGSGNGSLDVRRSDQPYVSFSRLVPEHTVGVEELINAPSGSKISPMERKGKMKQGGVCDNTEAEASDCPQKRSYLRNEQTESSKVNRPKVDKEKYNSKELAHWLEHKRKYDTGKHVASVLNSSRLKDITNVNLHPHSEPSSAESTPRSESSFPLSKSRSNTASKSLNSSGNWSCNMNAVLKRTQELEEEIRQLEGSPRNDDLDTSCETEHSLSDSTIYTNKQSKHVPAHALEERTMSVKETEVLTSEHFRGHIRPSGVRDTPLSSQKEHNVLGKPPVPPSKKHVQSLRDVGEDHFPQSRHDASPKLVRKHMRKHDSAPCFSHGAGFGSKPDTGHQTKDTTFIEAILSSVQQERPRRNGRRTISDLGFRATPPSPKRSPNRTVALLGNPTMRQHLARSMGLCASASEAEIQEAMDEKLESVMGRGARMGRSSSTVSLCSPGYQGMGNLYKTGSLSEGLNHQENGDNSLNGEVNLSACDEKKEKSSQKLFCTETNAPGVASHTIESDTSPPSKVSRFHIPSFRDFKRQKSFERKKYRSVSLETHIEDPIQEEICVPSTTDRCKHDELTNTKTTNTKSSSVTTDAVLNKLNNQSCDMPAFSSSDSSRDSTEVFCDCADSREHGPGCHSFDENQNSDKCPKCARLRSVVLPSHLGNSVQSQRDKQTHSGPSRGILKSRDELETVLLEASPRLSDEESQTSAKTRCSEVNRSASNVCDINAEEGRKKPTKERRQKLYKSDPLGNAHNVANSHNAVSEGAEIESELLSLVHDMHSGSAQSLVSIATSVASVDSCFAETSSEQDRPIPPHRTKKLKSRKKKKKQGKDAANKWEMDRSDSGVGKETLTPNSTEMDLSCNDCSCALSIVDVLDQPVRLCQRCAHHREERRSTILEIVHTEQYFGADLSIMHEEFYLPLKANGLLNQEQLDTIFLNLEELITLNRHFVTRLNQLVEEAKERGDEALSSVPIGELFLDTTNRLLAFETYCIDQSEAMLLLEQLEKERELLRIFLEVSQAENSALRRMHLKAFLVVPVQRIMKYPLLLNRLYKKTPDSCDDKPTIKQARLKIEEILEHINFKTKATGSLRMKKRQLVQQLLRRPSDSINEDLELHKIAIESLGWSKHDVHIAYSGRLLYTVMPDLTQTKRGKVIKYTTVHALLVTQGKKSWPEKEVNSQVCFPKQTGVSQAAVVVLKEKQTRFSPHREPFFLDRCVISMDSDFPDLFAVHEMSSTHECYLFKSEDLKETAIWFNHLKQQSKDLGKWRRRRNALPNIMINYGK